LSKDILTAIVASKKMTDQEKIDFKSILKSLVYGSNTNIPKDEIELDPDTGS
jgi:hypothetical protein